MALENLISISFSQAEEAQMEQALQILEDIMNKKLIHLSPEQRKEYGRLGYEMEKWADKAEVHMEQKKDLIPAFVDAEEYTRDMTAHTFISKLNNRLETIFNAFSDTQKVLGADILHTAYAFYRHVKNCAEHNQPGAREVYEDLRVQFPGRPSKPNNGGNSTK